MKISTIIEPAIEAEEPEDFTDLLTIIRKLTPRQQDALGKICCGDDSCLVPQTAKALARKGLITYGLEPMELGRGKVTLACHVYRASVASIRVHLAWCIWCSEQVEGLQ